MSNLNLPQITWKKGAIVVGVLLLVAFAFSALTSNQRMGVLGFPAIQFDYYDAATTGSAPSYGGVAQGGYGKAVYRDMGVAESLIAPMPPMPGPVSDAPAGEEKIIKNASLSLLVANVDVAAKEVNAIRTRLGGQIGNSNFREYGGGSRSGDITIWVPSARFDEAMAELKKLALRVNNESVNVSDVSAQFVDLEARLKTLRATEAQYLAILERSGKLSDVLDVTRELTNTRTQIEQIEGQREYLSRQVALSSIHITLTQEASPADLSDEWRPLAVIKAAAKQTLAELTRFIDDVLVFLVALPLFLLKLAFYGVILWVLWRAGRFVYARIRGGFPSAGEKV